MQHDSFLERLVTGLAEVPGIDAIVLGGSRARGTEHSGSDYDIGLYYSAARTLDIDRLQAIAKKLADRPETAVVSAVGEWGPWIVGGAWLSVEGRKVDLLYRNIDAVRKVMKACRAGKITMDYQPGHPHGFCSAIWMGEIAYGRPLSDPRGTIAELKSMAQPYPKPLREALMHRFRWEILFSIENAEIAVSRGEQTHIAGCTYRVLACMAQVLFALNEQYLINEKGALAQAAEFPLTIPDLMKDVAGIWQLIGEKNFTPALRSLRSIEQRLCTLTQRLG